MEKVCAGGSIVRADGLELAKLTPVDVFPETETEYGVGVLTFVPETWNVMRPPPTGIGVYALICAVSGGPIAPAATWRVTLRLAVVTVPDGILLATSVSTVTPGWAVPGEGVGANAIGVEADCPNNVGGFKRSASPSRPGQEAHIIRRLGEFITDMPAFVELEEFRCGRWSTEQSLIGVATVEGQGNSREGGLRLGVRVLIPLSTLSR